jgi:addiction module HigA family antidote
MAESKENMVTKLHNSWVAPMHPGEIIRRRFFAKLDVSQADFCRHYGFSETAISRLFAGQTKVTAATAIKLSEAFDMSPMFFMNLQSQYDLAVAGDVDGQEEGVIGGGRRKQG